jgi:pteridine reductase
MHKSDTKIIITGAARRGGAAIAKRIHANGYNVILHCRESSRDEAQVLCSTLCNSRAESAEIWAEDLRGNFQAPPFSDKVVGIVANASIYECSSIDNYETQLENDLDTHLVGHLKLISYCRNSLIKNCGAIVAIGDIAVNRPSKGYLGYQIAKGALLSAVKSLAVELAPHVRVNAVLPGTLEWPCNDIGLTEERKKAIVSSTLLGRTGTFDELASAVNFLLFEATFSTGHFLTLDGGRSIYLE